MTFKDWFVSKGYDTWNDAFDWDEAFEVSQEAWNYQQERIDELELDKRRLEWLALNKACVWLQDGWYNILDSCGTCIVHMVDDWRDALDQAMEDSDQ